MAVSAKEAPPRIHTLPVLGVDVAVTDYAKSVAWCLQAARHSESTGRVFAVEAANTHVVALAKSESTFGEAIDSFDLVVPDGMPLVWSLNRRLPEEQKLTDRVYGPTLMLRVLEASDGLPDQRHFLLGGRQDTLDELEKRLGKRHPNLELAGSYSPPFGTWPDDEFDRICRRILASGANHVWVGLGCPKQERWIADHRDRLPPAVYYGIGAAFAFHSGEISQAPFQIQNLGMEWLWRLIAEPRRLMSRYLVYNSLYLFHSLREKLAGGQTSPEPALFTPALPSPEPLHENLPPGGKLAKTFEVLGVEVSDLNMDRASESLLSFAASPQENGNGYVCVTGVHGVIEAQDDDNFRQILNRALLVTPDGMPLVWVGKAVGNHHMSRVYGPDLMLEIFRRTEHTGLRHFFYGGKEGVCELLAEKLLERFPGVDICGSYTPPFRPLNPEEEADLEKQIKDSRADMVWVGLSTPKQERFMADWVDRTQARLWFGVGAAFDFHAGLVGQAPKWMQNAGLEWFYRLLQEPRRLWPRYSKINPRFLLSLLREFFQRRTS